MKAPNVARPKPALKKNRPIKDCATGNWIDEFQIVQIDGRRTRVLVTADDADTGRRLLGAS